MSGVSSDVSKQRVAGPVTILAMAFATRSDLLRGTRRFRRDRAAARQRRPYPLGLFARQVLHKAFGIRCVVEHGEQVRGHLPRLRSRRLSRQPVHRERGKVVPGPLLDFAVAEVAEGNEGWHVLEVAAGRGGEYRFLRLVPLRDERGVILPAAIGICPLAATK